MLNSFQHLKIFKSGQIPKQVRNDIMIVVWFTLVATATGKKVPHLAHNPLLHFCPNFLHSAGKAACAKNMSP